MVLFPRTKLWAWSLGTFGTSSPTSTLRYTVAPGLWTRPCSGGDCSKAEGRIRTRMASTTRLRLRELKSLPKCGDASINLSLVGGFSRILSSSPNKLSTSGGRYVWAFYIITGNKQRRSQTQSWRPGVEIQGKDGYHSFFWHGAFAFLCPCASAKMVYVDQNRNA